MDSPEDLGPRDLTGVLPLEEERLVLGVQETESLGVDTDKGPSLGRVDLVAAEVATFDTHCCSVVVNKG